MEREGLRAGLHRTVSRRSGADYARDCRLEGSIHIFFPRDEANPRQIVVTHLQYAVRGFGEDDEVLHLASYNGKDIGGDRWVDGMHPNAPSETRHLEFGRFICNISHRRAGVSGVRVYGVPFERDTSQERYGLDCYQGIAAVQSAEEVKDMFMNDKNAFYDDQNGLLWRILMSAFITPATLFIATMIPMSLMLHISTY